MFDGRIALALAALLASEAPADARAGPPPPPTPPAVVGACVSGRQAGLAQDGKSDDTGAFERAVNGLGRAGGGCLALEGPVALCDALLVGSKVTVVGTNEQSTYLTPLRPSCGLVRIGDATRPVNALWFERVGFVQPVAGRQGKGTTFVSFDNAYDSGVQRFFVRNAWDAFRLGPLAGAIYLTVGNLRTVANDMVVVEGSNDEYFDHLIADYDEEVGGARGNSRSCFDVRSSRGSVVITSGDLIHCGVGLRLAPKAGDAVSWTWVSDTAFDTCTSSYGGNGILLAPEGKDAHGRPSAVEGLKVSNSWSSGCDRGLFSNPTGGAYVQAVALDGLTAQGNSKEAVLLQGDTRSVTFVAPEMFRNSAEREDTFATVRVAGGVGNVSFLGGKVGGIAGQPVHVAKWGIVFDEGYDATATVVGTDLCGYGPGGAGLRVHGRDVTTASPPPRNVVVLGAACSTR